MPKFSLCGDGDVLIFKLLWKIGCKSYLNLRCFGRTSLLIDELLGEIGGKFCLTLNYINFIIDGLV